MSSIWPINVRAQSGRASSVSGGKDYHLVLISRDDGRSLFITRFGKKDTWGIGFKVQQFGSLSEAEEAYRKKYREKLERQYSEFLIKEVTDCADLEEFKAAIGDQYWYNIGIRHLEFLLPGYDLTGARGDKTASVEASAPLERSKPVKSEPATPVKATIEDRVQETPIFGMF